MPLGQGSNDDRISVHMTVMCSTAEQVAKVSEVIGRTAAGLALDDFNANVSFIRVPAPEEGWELNG